MSLVMIEGWEDQGAVVLRNGTVTTVLGRTGNGIQVNGSSGYFTVRLPPLFDTVTIGFAWRPTTFGTNTNPGPLALASDGGSVGHLFFNVNGQTINVLRGSTTIATTPVAPFTTSRWYYWEVQAKISDTVGFVKIDIDGVNALTTATTLDTRNGGVSPNIDQLQFGHGTSGSAIFDDMYVATGAGDSFLGDCIVSTLLPNGNGAQSDFLGSDGNSTDNYQLVDELPPSGTDYVSSAVIGDQDLYTLTDLPAHAGTIIAVAPTLYVSKDEVGPRQVKPLLHRTSTFAGAAGSLDFAYAQRQAVFATDPETGLAWVAADVNTLQAGVEVA